jgi:hypothetical protein
MYYNLMTPQLPLYHSTTQLSQDPNPRILSAQKTLEARHLAFLKSLGAFGSLLVLTGRNVESVQSNQ